MKLVLTDKGTQQEVVVDSEHMFLFEPELDNSQSPPVATGRTHIVSAAGTGRIVEESPASIAAAVGTFNIAISKAASVAEVAKGVKKK